MKKIIRMFLTSYYKKTPTYGWGIFRQQSWLDKKVNEAMWKRNFFLD